MKMLWKATGEKRCTECGTTKPLSEYSFQKKGTKAGHPVSRCKPCGVIVGRRNFLKKSPTERKEIYLRRRLLKLGLTREQYDDMLAKQHGGCAICGETSGPAHVYRDGRVRRLSVDHSHKSGKVRGLLCSHCNVALGHFRDSLPLMQRAMEYLRLHGETWV